MAPRPTSPPPWRWPPASGSSGSPVTPRSADRVAEELVAWLGDPERGGDARAAHGAGLRTLRAGARRVRCARRRPGRLARRRRSAPASSWPACRRCSSARSHPTTSPTAADPAGGGHTPGARARPAAPRRPRLRTRARGRRSWRVRPPWRHRRHLPCRPALPVRVEWFGDEIDSLRAFDPADQRGTGPGRVGRAPAGLRVPARRRHRSDLLVGAHGRTVERLPEGLQADLARFDAGVLGDAAELWGGYLAPHTGLDHLGSAIWLSTNPRRSPPRPSSSARRPRSVAPNWSGPGSSPRAGQRRTPRRASGRQPCTRPARSS